MTEDTHLVVWVRGANHSFWMMRSPPVRMTLLLRMVWKIPELDGYGCGFDTGSASDTAAGEVTDSGDTALATDSAAVGDTGTADDLGGVFDGYRSRLCAIDPSSNALLRVARFGLYAS